MELWLVAYGPWLLFAMAVLETCFVTGLVVPSGLATAVGTALATQGQMELRPVLLAALAGGWIGDGSGYWVGRWFGARVLRGRGRLARVVTRRRAVLNQFFDRHPLYSVTVARWVSFVRSLMPMAAGMSRIRFGTYLLYELPGLLGWLALYATVGLLAGESWELVTRVLGIGGGLGFAAAGVFLWLALRRGRSGPVGDGP